jgi:hypothetical protein
LFIIIGSQKTASNISARQCQKCQHIIAPTSNINASTHQHLNSIEHINTPTHSSIEKLKDNSDEVFMNRYDSKALHIEAQRARTLARTLHL